MKTIAEAQSICRSFEPHRNRCRGGLGRLRPHILEHDAREQHEARKAANPAIRFTPKAEGERIYAALFAEERIKRQRAALYVLRQLPIPGVRQAKDHWNQLIDGIRRDTGQSFLDASTTSRPTA